MSKTNEEVYDEITDRENFIAKKLLGKVQHAIYIPIQLYEEVLTLSKNDSRSFNRQVEHLMRLGLKAYKDSIQV